MQRTFNGNALFPGSRLNGTLAGKEIVLKTPGRQGTGEGTDIVMSIDFIGVCDGCAWKVVFTRSFFDRVGPGEWHNCVAVKGPFFNPIRDRGKHD